MSYKIVFLALILMAIFTAKTYATTDYTGGGAYTTTGTGGDAGYLWPIVATQSGTLQSIGVNVIDSGGQTIDGAIYSNIAGAPGTLLGNTVITNASDGWDDLAVPQTVVINLGNTYWVDWYLSGSTTVGRGGSSSPLYQSTDPEGTFTTPCPCILEGSYSPYNFRMTYTPGGYLYPNVTVAPTTSTIFIGQSQTYVATLDGSVSPFSYQWYVYNSNQTLIYNTIKYTGLGFSNSLTYQPNALGTYYANVVVGDNTGNYANSVQSILLVVPYNASTCVDGIPSNILNAVPFENYNSTPLTIYTDSAGTLTGYYALSNTLPLQEIVNQTAYGLPYNASTTLAFYPNYIGQYNITASTIFHCQWWPASGGSGGGSGGTIVIPQGTVGNNNDVDYAALTIAIFAAITCMGYVYYSTNKSQRNY